MINDFIFRFVMLLTRILPEITPTLRLRGYLSSRCFKSCGKNLQITKDVRLYNCSNISFGNDVFLSAGTWIMASCNVTIEDEVMLGPYSIVITGDHTKIGNSFRFGEAVRGPIKLRKGCWIASHAVVTRGVTVGQGSLLAACSVANKDIPDNSLYGGVPAKKIKEI